LYWNENTPSGVVRVMMRPEASHSISYSAASGFALTLKATYLLFNPGINTWPNSKPLGSITLVRYD